MDSFTVSYANVTSWRKHGATMQELEADVIIAVETRMPREVWEGELVRLQARSWLHCACRVRPHTHQWRCLWRSISHGQDAGHT